VRKKEKEGIRLHLPSTPLPQRVGNINELGLERSASDEETVDVLLASCSSHTHTHTHTHMHNANEGRQPRTKVEKTREGRGSMG
jgi:hypothetical protein